MAFTLNTAAALLPPAQCYPPTAQGMLNLVANNLLITGLDSLNTFSFGPTTPAANLQDRPWIKTDAQYKLIGLYTFTAGSWQPAASPILPGTITDFFGLSSSVIAPYYICNGQVVNGSIGGALTTPNLSGLVTLGAGTNPSTGTNFAYGSTGGEEKHTQTINELVAHLHAPLSGTAFVTRGSSGSLGTVGGSGPSDDTTASTGGGQAFNVMQPYMALYKIIFWP